MKTTETKRYIANSNTTVEFASLDEAKTAANKEDKFVSTIVNYANPEEKYIKVGSSKTGKCVGWEINKGQWS